MSQAADRENLLYLLARLERLNGTFVGEVCQRHDISPSELRVMSMLSRDDGTGVRPGRISQYVIQTSGGLAATLRRLEAAGRIERVDNEDDARSRLVRITEQGRRFHDDVLRELIERYEAVFDRIDVRSALDGVRELVSALEWTGNHASTEGLDLAVRQEVGAR